MRRATADLQERPCSADWESCLVDNVLEDCFQLISLFFLTIGRIGEAPAV